MESESSQPAKKNWMARAGHALISASENQGCWPTLYRFLKWLTWIFILLYVVALVAFIAALSWIGEKNVTSAFLLYLPPAIWWLPAVPLAFFGLLLNRKALLILLLGMLWFGYAFLGWRMGGTGENPSGALKVMTYNRGQHMNQSLQPFKEATTPDIILFQEASGRAAGYAAAADYSEFIATKSLGEHTILSRYPILEEALLPALPGNSPKAARFVIDWNGKQVAIYSVHLQTPRDVLGAQMRGGFLYGILGLPGTPWAAKRRQLQIFWDDQMADAELILKAVREDPLPAIVAGDFNAPHMGYIHRLITRELGDSHATVGQGCGFSFPGSTHNPLSAGGPWMRIDYVFFTQHWQAVNCITEPDRPSQHRALTSTLVLKNL
ncbi:MAG: endonuclease/exonuclease/phosphatase family protein [Prosthecobacter sp.]|nr:endonuclease/exonuclease/phosphatase family protein [Prosthecobacter sp.]